MKEPREPKESRELKGLKELQKRVERLQVPLRSLVSVQNEVIRVGEVVFIQYRKGRVEAVTVEGRRHELPENLNYYEKLFRGCFLRVHRSYLVAFDRIEGTFERFPAEAEGSEDTAADAARGEEESAWTDEWARLAESGEPDGAMEAVSEAELVEPELRGKADECELALRGSEERIPVTSTYGKAVKKALGIGSFHNLVPEHPADKKLRQYGLIDFGWRELYNLDAGDAAAVAAFKERWDIKRFSKERMLSYFRQYGVKEINKKRVIKNIIYQMWRWIVAGIEEPSDGNIRSMWYRIKSVLAHHANILGPGDVNTFYSTLLEMIEAAGLFRYRDFGFMDMNAPYCAVSERHPEIVLASEKIGHFLFIRGLAREHGVSFICTKGEPAVISMEYFADELHEKCQGRALTVFCISDVDPAGYSIERNLVKRLKMNGHEVVRLVKLVDTEIFDSDDIGVLRFPVVSFEKKGEIIKPVAPALMSQVTKALEWFRELQDPRLISERDKGGGWKVVTIWGIESDAADRKLIEERFKSGLQRLGRARRVVRRKKRGK